jgi:hypothetical protein
LHHSGVIPEAVGVRVEQEAVLAKLLGQKQGIDRPNHRSLTFAQQTPQFLAAVSADRIEAADHIPPEQGWKLPALLESLDDEMSCDCWAGSAYCDKRS